MEKETIIKEVVSIIKRYLPSEKYKLFLFGSWAKKTAAPTSDIDIGILGDEPVEETILFRVKSDIAGIQTLRSIDIVDLRKADEKFRKEVLKYAQILP